LAGLWFSCHKPNMPTFLKPFIAKCNDLQETPLLWNHAGSTFQSRVFFPIFTADSSARPLIQGGKQHNGYFGCPWCICPGERSATLTCSHPSSKKLNIAISDPFLPTNSGILKSSALFASLCRSNLLRELKLFPCLGSLIA